MTGVTNKTELFAAADMAARLVSKVARHGSDEHDDYGLSFEYLVRDPDEYVGDWITVDYELGSDRVSVPDETVYAIRLYDRDGERTEVCRTAEEVAIAAWEWLRCILDAPLPEGDEG